MDEAPEIREERTIQFVESGQCAYVPPRLVRHGSLAEITASVGGSSSDGGRDGGYLPS